MVWRESKERERITESRSIDSVPKRMFQRDLNELNEIAWHAQAGYISGLSACNTAFADSVEPIPR